MPWQVLSDIEVNELNDLLTRLKAALTPTMEAVPA
jgi:hypothetical protein